MSRRRALTLIVLVTGICVGLPAAADAASLPPPTGQAVCADVIYTNGQTDQICVNF